jgi:hypothetical protein
MLCARLQPKRTNGHQIAKFLWSPHLLTKAMNSHPKTHGVSLFLSAITPDDALDTFVSGDTARVALQPNTPLTSALVSSAQDTVKVPDGWRIVALPADMPSPPLQLRDSVDVVAGQAVIAAGVLVVSLQPLTIAVPADVAASVASVAQLGEASLISAR